MHRLLFTFFVTLFAVQQWARAEVAPSSALAPVTEFRADWFDKARNRNVPVKIYLPTSDTAPAPVIIFSHGLGGSRETYSYLGEYWAKNGFVVVHPQHQGSDEAVWKDSGTNGMEELKKAALNPFNAVNRPKDVSFVIDTLVTLNEEATSPLFHRLNLRKIGMAGHSFGAFTTLAVCGETLSAGFGMGFSFADPRVTAGIAMSSPIPQRDPAKAFETIKSPILHITGVYDAMPLALGSGPADRRVPYDNTPGPGQYLIIYGNADHMTFAGVASRQKRQGGEIVRDSVCQVSTVFWNAYLKDDANALAQLEVDPMKKTLAESATYERK